MKPKYNWQADREMSGREFKTIIKTLGMTQAGAGRYLGISERTARRVVIGQSELPPSAVLLLRSLNHHDELPEVPKWKREGF